jgi:hypothetical protein
MDVEIGAEAALFPEKEYINGTAVAVQPYSKAKKHTYIYKRERDRHTDILSTVLGQTDI